MQNAMSGFNKTGIYSTDKTVFSESDFVTAQTTDINVSTVTATITQVSPPSSTNTASLPIADAPLNNEISTPSISTTPPKEAKQCKTFVTPADIIPIPSINSENKAKSKSS